MSDQAQPVEEVGDGISLGDVWAIVRMHTAMVIASGVAMTVIAGVVTMLLTKMYSSTAVVHVSTIAPQEMEMGKSVTNVNLVWNRELYIQTQIALLKSRSFKDKILERYEKLGLDDGIRPDAPGTAGLMGSMQIKPRQGTELLDIVYTTPDPEVSARLANITAQVLRDDTLERITESALEARAWLSVQLEDYDRQRAAATSQLLEYQRTHEMLDVDVKASALGAQLESLKQALAQAHTQRVQQETVVRGYEDLIRQKKIDVLVKQMGTPLTQAMMTRYAEVIAAHARIESTFGPKMPEYQASEREVKRIEEEFRLEVERQLASERATLAMLIEKEENLQAAIDGELGTTLGAAMRREDYEKKKVELDNIKETYAKMVDRMNELELQSKTQLNNVRIVEEARPIPTPTSPNLLLNLAVGLTAGLLLGAGAAFMKEWMDDTVSSPFDIHTHLRSRTLAMVPIIKDAATDVDQTLYTHTHPKSEVAETMRGMRTLLELDSAGAPRRLLVTSALASEGKTSTAVRLAISYANLNRKVLLIDADLRRPRVHKVFAENRSPGLTTLLSEGAPPVASVVRPTPVPHLFYVPAGSSTDRPNELLGGTAFPALLDALDQEFDMIVVDTPPSGFISDARMISRYVDGVIVLARQQKTSRKLVRETLRGLEQVGARVLGVVLNEVDFRKKNRYDYYYYNYRYSYKYDGKYTEDDEGKETAAK